MSLKHYVIRGIVGLLIGIALLAASDILLKRAYTFREDKDGDGQKELYLRKTDVGEEYLLEEDSKGNITRIPFWRFRIKSQGIIE